MTRNRFNRRTFVGRSLVTTGFLAAPWWLARPSQSQEPPSDGYGSAVSVSGDVARSLATRRVSWARRLRAPILMSDEQKPSQGAASAKSTQITGNCWTVRILMS